MDVVSLPLLSGRESPDFAFGVISDMRRGAALVGTGGSYSLAWASAISKARQEGIKRLSDINNLQEARLASTETLPGNLNLHVPHDTYVKYEQLLDKMGVRFLILTVGNHPRIADAMVITRTEEATRMIRGGTLQCDGPGRHTFPEPEAVPGPCELCEGTVRLVR